MPGSEHVIISRTSLKSRSVVSLLMKTGAGAVAVAVAAAAVAAAVAAVAAADSDCIGWEER